MTKKKKIKEVLHIFMHRSTKIELTIVKMTQVFETTVGKIIFALLQ